MISNAWWQFQAFPALICMSRISQAVLSHITHFLPPRPTTLLSAVSLFPLEVLLGTSRYGQMEGNATYVRDTGELASGVPTETMFELFDPQKNFSTAKFTYTWDLGNGEVIQGTEPVARYHYSESGNYTLRLKVGAKVTKYAPLITDVYSTDVQVLDAIKHIELNGPSDYKVSQNTSLAFHVDGSPPIWVCWRFLPNCVPDMIGGCTLTVLEACRGSRTLIRSH
ncbi:hypothetical protein FQN60_003368 [Etheostoma spectabile]|uniref:PKD domain-containing protein n=1 Tax=Etheostoma spectabile TaxID=54343 RepID=A0A5J5CJE5_9PERO|nr:hypothetical protein FQN60_003368 [Etheostoma spectabile]